MGDVVARNQIFPGVLKSYSIQHKQTSKIYNQQKVVWLVEVTHNPSIKQHLDIS